MSRICTRCRTPKVQEDEYVIVKSCRQCNAVNMPVFVLPLGGFKLFYFSSSLYDDILCIRKTLFVSHDNTTWLSSKLFRLFFTLIKKHSYQRFYCCMKWTRKTFSPLINGPAFLLKHQSRLATFTFISISFHIKDISWVKHCSRRSRWCGLLSSSMYNVLA